MEKTKLDIEAEVLNARFDLVVASGNLILSQDPEIEILSGKHNSAVWIYPNASLSKPVEIYGDYNKDYFRFLTVEQAPTCGVIAHLIFIRKAKVLTNA
jgi:hypothetical protein